MSLRTCPNCGMPKHSDRECEFCPGYAARIAILERQDLERRVARLERAAEPPSFWTLILFGLGFGVWVFWMAWVLIT